MYMHIFCYCSELIYKTNQTYVARARDKRTGEIVALKRIKLSNPELSREGFPLLALREINALMKMREHENIVHVRGVVIGSDLNKVFVVMDYAEHTLRDLNDQIMRQRFTPAEVKCLMLQLLEGVRYMHDEQWIIHRDLKTSNLLLTNRGTLQICDFGMARTYGSPLRKLTPNVITLWYRAPEMLLGQDYYTVAVDMWSVGCIFYELLTKKTLFAGQSEIDQIQTIFRILGTPNEQRWEGFNDLPAIKKFRFSGSRYPPPLVMLSSPSFAHVLSFAHLYQFFFFCSSPLVRIAFICILAKYLIIVTIDRSLRMHVSIFCVNCSNTTQRKESRQQRRLNTRTSRNHRHQNLVK